MTEELDYVGRLPCGCYVVWISHKMNPKEIAKEVAWCIRKGLSVERMSTEDARKKVNACVHKEQQKELAI